jgi:hypothetical protein
LFVRNLRFVFLASALQPNIFAKLSECLIKNSEKRIDSAGAVIYHSLQAIISGKAGLLRRSKSGGIVRKRDDGERRGTASRWSLGPRIANDETDLQKVGFAFLKNEIARGN